jgi:succinyl-diaminopimelate desuccinylase
LTDVQADTLALAKALIARRSLTPADDGCLDVIAARLTAAGFACERLDRGGVSNLWARRGTSAPLVCLAGHVDVVPTGPVERWTSDPFTPVVRDGLLFGRGAADMKASVAALVTAVERFVATNPDHPGTIALLFTSDEEGDGIHGTAAVVETLRARQETIDACIIGEPTSAIRLGDTIKHGRRGSLQGTLTIRGVQCHIAYPEQGRNPIHEAAPALAELAATTWDLGDDAFSPTSFQVSNIHGGTGATNIIPGALQVVFNFRFSPESTAVGLEARVRSILDRHGLDYELTCTLAAQPFITPPGQLVDVMRDAVRAVTGVTPALSTTGGTSDGRFLADVSREVVEFGPLNASIHAVDEHVAVADLAPLSLVYERAITALLI